jgi:hypothetical protein
MRRDVTSSGATGPRWALRLVGLAWALTGCKADSFACSDASQCQLDALAGYCEADGYCSFDDSSCDSGRRYGDLAGSGVAGECVAVDDGPTTGAATSGGATTSASTLGTSATMPGDTSAETTLGVATSDATTDDTTGSAGSTSSTSDTSGMMVTEVWGDAPGSDHPGTLQDTWFNLNDEVHAGEDELRLYTWPSFSVANVIVMQWDLSAIAGAMIVSAELTLHSVGYEGMLVTEQYGVTVHRIVGVEPDQDFVTGVHYDVASPWTANACCFDDVPMAQADITGPEASTAVGSAPGPAVWDVTATIQALVDAPDEDHGFILNPDVTAAADADRRFAASEAADASTRPTLEITYVR